MNFLRNQLFTAFRPNSSTRSLARNAWPTAIPATATTAAEGKIVNPVGIVCASGFSTPKVTDDGAKPAASPFKISLYFSNPDWAVAQSHPGSAFNPKPRYPLRDEEASQDPSSPKPPRDDDSISATPQKPRRIGAFFAQLLKAEDFDRIYQGMLAHPQFPATPEEWKQVWAIFFKNLNAIEQSRRFPHSMLLFAYQCLARNPRSVPARAAVSKMKAMFALWEPLDHFLWAKTLTRVQCRLTPRESNRFAGQASRFFREPWRWQGESDAIELHLGILAVAGKPQELLQAVSTLLDRSYDLTSIEEKFSKVQELRGKLDFIRQDPRYLAAKTKSCYEMLREEVWLPVALYLEVPFDPRTSPPPNPLLIDWLRAKAFTGHLKGKELLRAIDWALEEYPHCNASFVKIVEMMKRLEDPAGQSALLEKIRRRVQSRRFQLPEQFFQLCEIAKALRAQCREERRENFDFFAAIFGGRDFILRHPWDEYGFSPKVVERVRSFARQIERIKIKNPEKTKNDSLVSAAKADATSLATQTRKMHSAQAKLLAGLLLSGNHQLRPHWKSRLILSVKPKAFQNMMGFLRLWNNVPQEMQDWYIDEQNDQLESEAPRDLGPETEKIKLMALIRRRFREKIPSPLADALLQRAETDPALWKHSGILDRLIQFSSYASPEGLKTLVELIQRLLDPKQTRLEAVEGANVLPKLSKKPPPAHINYFGKFAELRKTLAKQIADPETRNRFLEIWETLWHSHPVPGTEGAEYLTVTHDLLRWILHGEVPVLTCQALNACLDTEYTQDGEPLNRILLPQLKLAEFHIQGELVARTVLEVVMRGKGESKRLGLLVERQYSGLAMTAEATERFRESILRYAEALGIAPEDVIFGNEALENVRPRNSLPRLLNYRLLPPRRKIHRDTFF